MKALSLTQPWAWLVIHGGKDVENRRWNTRYRGAFLIHAAKGMTEDQYDDALLFALDVDPTIVVPSPRALERGGIVGVAELYAVQPPLTEDQKRLTMERFANRGIDEDPWHMQDQFGFRLRNVRPLPFLPCKGALGFWGDFDLRDGLVVPREARA